MYVVIYKFDDLGIINVWIVKTLNHLLYICTRVQYSKGVYTRWFGISKLRICSSALRKVHMHIDLTHWSSIHLIKYVLATSIYRCSVLGSRFCSDYWYYILVTTFRKVIVWFSFGWYKGDWLMQIYLMFDWSYRWIQSEYLWNVVLGRKEKVVAFCK